MKSVSAWRAFFVVAAIVLYGVSVNGPIYHLTSPATMPYHELARKTYAVLAFALLGFALERSQLRRVHGVIAVGIAIALYSYAIEIGQIVLSLAQETFAEHSFDVASGLAGGAAGAFAVLLMTHRTAPVRRVEAIALAVAFVVLAWGFTVTYGRMA